METARDGNPVPAVSANYLATAVCWLLASGVLGALTGLALMAGGSLGIVPAALFNSAHMGAGHLGWVVMALIGIYLAIYGSSSGQTNQVNRWGKIIYWLYALSMFIFLLSLAFGYAHTKRYAELPHILALFKALILISFTYLLGRLLFQGRNKQEIAVYYAFLSLVYITIYLVALIFPAQGLYLDILVNISTHFLFDGMMLAVMGLTIYILPRLLGRPLYSEFIAIVQLWMALMMVLFASSRHLVRLGLHPQLEFWTFFHNVLAVAIIFLYFYNIYMTIRPRNVKEARPRELPFRYLVASNIYLGLTALQGLSFLISLIYLREPNPKMLVTAHAHLALTGFVTLGIMGAIYYVLPLITRRGIYSEKLGSLGFYLVNAGLALSLLSVSAARLIKPAYAHGGAEVPAGQLNYYLLPQYFGDFLVFVGIIIFAVNVFRSIRPNPLNSRKILVVACLSAGLVVGNYWPAPLGSVASVTAGPLIFVANEGEGTVSVINGQSNKVIRELKIGGKPHNVNTDPLGRYLWVTDHSPAGRVIFVDLEQMRIVAEVSLPGGAGHVVPHPAGEEIYVSVEEAGIVAVIDIASRELVRRIATGTMPHGLVITPDGEEILVPNMMSGDVTRVNHDRGAVTGTIALQDTSHGLHTDPGHLMPVAIGVDGAGQQLFATLAGTHEIVAINRESGAVSKRVKIAGSTTPGPIQTPVHPSGKYLYVPSMATGAVHKIDLATFTEVETIATGEGAHGIAYTRGGRFAYVTNTYANTVAVIDTARDIVVTEIPVGLNPNGVCVLYGSNQGW